jgi:protein SCO1/2
MIARLCIALWLLLGPGTALAQTGFDPFGAARIDERLGARVPLDAVFRDSSGRAATLRAIAGGKPILLVPVLHQCPNLCGVTLAGVGDAIAAQKLRPGTDFVVVAFGIDPKEGPAAAADDLARMRARAPAGKLTGVYALTGAQSAIRAVTDAIGYRYAWDPRIRQYAHAAATAVITPEGRLSGWLYGLTPRPADLEQAIGAAGVERSGRWGEALLLLCYHYDPATGRYTPAIEKILRFAGALTVAALAVLLFGLRRKRA